VQEAQCNSNGRYDDQGPRKGGKVFEVIHFSISRTASLMRKRLPLSINSSEIFSQERRGLLLPFI
jgi:hypothetical protein